jgi:hypothetical protein
LLVVEIHADTVPPAGARFALRAGPYAQSYSAEDQQLGLRLPAGSYETEVIVLDAVGRQLASGRSPNDVQIQSGQTTFVTVEVISSMNVGGDQDGGGGDGAGGMGGAGADVADTQAGSDGPKDQAGVDIPQDALIGNDDGGYSSGDTPAIDVGGAGGAAGGASGSGGADATGGTGGSPTKTCQSDSCAANEMCQDGVCVCNPEYRTDANDGVFVVAQGGDDVNGLGTAASPFASITKGIAVANGSMLGRVYVGPGTYSETLNITDSPLGVSIEGGWQVSGEIWKQNCEPTVASLTTLLGGTVAVQVMNVTHASQIANMTIKTAPVPPANTDADGESAIGVLVSGDGSSFSLLGVTVAAADAADAGTAGTRPQGSGVFGGGMNCGDGAKGVTTPGGASASTPGIFAASGFIPSAGMPGGSGTPGAPGIQGGPGSCANLFSCAIGCGMCYPAQTGQICGSSGVCGGGGGPGASGAPGRGGGASVALLAVGNATVVRVGRSSLTSGRGGAGSPGGAGGVGGPPSPGYPGTSQCRSTAFQCSPAGTCSCGLFCTDTAWACDYQMTCGVAGSAGGGGGPGGDGGVGGAGAGGPSYTVVTVASATVVVDAASTLMFGSGGLSTGNAVSGGAAPTFDQP